MSAVVRQVDHLLIRVEDPRPPLSLLAGTLRLPVHWEVERLGALESGGIAVGNANLELIRFGRRRTSESRSGAARLFGIALEPPPLAAALPELSRRGIPHSPPVPFAGTSPSLESYMDGGARYRRNPLWTNVFLGGFLGDTKLARAFSRRLLGRDSRLTSALGRFAGTVLSSSLSERLPSSLAVPSGHLVFLVDYPAGVDRMRAAGRVALSACGGGVLGVEGVKEVIVGATDLPAEEERWKRLFDPTPLAADGTWQLGTGPAIRLVADREDRLQALVLKVTSLEKAKAFLRQRGMLGTVSPGEVAIEPREIHALDVRLVE